MKQHILYNYSMKKGAKHTKESIEKMRNSLKGRKPPKTAWKKGRIPWNKGKTGIQTAWNKKPDLYIICKNCGKKFKIYHYRIGIAKYCSKKCSSEAKKGKSTWNKGGKAHWCAGENNWQWKGGITDENEKIRKSVEYREWRRKVFKRDNWTCVKCGHRSKGKDIVADHIKPFCLYPELRFDVNNGRTLCKKCDRKYGWNYRRYLKNQKVLSKCVVTNL